MVGPAGLGGESSVFAEIDEVRKVEADGEKLLTGCAIQEDNGSAAIAQDYAPTSYETARSSEYQLGNGGMREAMIASGLGVMLLVGAVAVL